MKNRVAEDEKKKAVDKENKSKTRFKA